MHIWQWFGCRCHMSLILKISCSGFGREGKFCGVGMCLTVRRFRKYMLQKCSASIGSYPNHRIIWHTNGNSNSFPLAHHLIICCCCTCDYLRLHHAVLGSVLAFFVCFRQEFPIYNKQSIAFSPLQYRNLEILLGSQLLRFSNDSIDNSSQSALLE